MQAKEKVLQFVAEYHENVAQLNEKISYSKQAIRDSQLEIQYIHAKELPEALEVRVLSGDNTMEVRLKKKVSKLEKELQEYEEELLVLESVLHRYKYGAGDKASEFEKLYREEKKILEQEVVGKMMRAKKEFKNAIEKESTTLRELNSVDVKLQEVLFEAGRKNGVYSYMEIPKSVNLSTDEFKRLVVGMT
ncbi:hypothetical protein [Peribacillus sp. SCS-37]|uniref:hypothetical protein n=1 Tax=Paraperibacillus esterisolvens TaxID=3115296 RepID=UPI003906323A